MTVPPKCSDCGRPCEPAGPYAARRCNQCAFKAGRVEARWEDDRRAATGEPEHDDSDLGVRVRPLLARGLGPDQVLDRMPWGARPAAERIMEETDERRAIQSEVDA